MSEAKRRGRQLLEDINARFIEDVGPVGEVLIEDAMATWRAANWRGPSAFRHYMKYLADNIDEPTLRSRFLHDAGQLLISAQSAKV